MTPFAIYILLDRSGSMGVRWLETLDALNGYVKEMASARPEAPVTLVAFDEPGGPVQQFILNGQPASPGGAGYQILRNATPAASFPPLSTVECQPRGGTPLLDSIGTITNAMLQARPERAVLVVLTDGHENASKHWSKSRTQERLTEIKAKGWEVLFLGADFDAVAQAGGLGVVMDKSLNMSSGHYASATQSMARNTVAYASTGAAVKFTDEDRKAAKGE